MRPRELARLAGPDNSGGERRKIDCDGFLQSEAGERERARRRDEERFYGIVFSAGGDWTGLGQFHLISTPRYGFQNSIRNSMHNSSI